MRTFPHHSIKEMLYKRKGSCGRLVIAGYEPDVRVDAMKTKKLKDIAVKTGILTAPLIVLFVIFLLLSSLLRTTKYDFDIDLCNIEIPQVNQRANCSFYLIVAFEIDDNSTPTKINIIRGEQFIFPEKMKKCIQNWKMTGLKENQKVLAIWTWKHGRGWISLRISTDDFSQFIKINPYSPY